MHLKKKRYYINRNSENLFIDSANLHACNNNNVLFKFYDFSGDKNQVHYLEIFMKKILKIKAFIFFFDLSNMKTLFNF